VIIGIDPGLSGALAILSDDGVAVDVLDLPTMQVGDGGKRVARIVNAIGLRFLLRYEKDAVGMVVMEMPQPMGRHISPLVLMSMGQSAGIIEGVASVFPFTRVAPHIWKKALGLGHDKEMSRARAQQLFPNIDLSRKKDHNRAEALLIAYWWTKHGR
jgi:crossover junction endodeoxyribonuclease RuvC